MDRDRNGARTERLDSEDVLTDDGALYETEDLIDSVRRRIRKMSASSIDAMVLSRDASRADPSNHDIHSLTLAAVLEDAAQAAPPPPPLSPRSPQLPHITIPSSPVSPRSSTGRVESSARSEEDEGEALRRDSAVFLQTFLDQKNLEKTPSFVMLTVHDGGEQHYSSMTLRELLRLVQQEIQPLCTASYISEQDTMAVGQVKYRDIRRLESILSAHEEPAILVRHHVVLMLLDPIRAIVLTNKMIVVIPDGADSMISMLTNEISSQHAEESGERMSEASSASSAVPFEIKAYEAILDTVVRMHRLEHSRISLSIRESLIGLKKRAIIPARLQEKMRGLKNALSSVTARVSAHRRALDELLDHDDEMAAMNITKLKNKPTLYRMPLGLEIMAYHEDIEVLIDSNFIDTTSLETELELLKEEIRGAEESVLLRLDTSRNQLLIANTQIAVCGSFAAVGSLIASMFGMNLENHREMSDHAWLYVTVLTASIVCIGIGLTFILLRKSGIIPMEA